MSTAAVEIMVEGASHSRSVAGGGSTFLWKGRRSGMGMESFVERVACEAETLT